MSLAVEEWENRDEDAWRLVPIKKSESLENEGMCEVEQVSHASQPSSTKKPYHSHELHIPKKTIPENETTLERKQRLINVEESWESAIANDMMGVEVSSNKLHLAFQFSQSKTVSDNSKDLDWAAKPQSEHQGEKLSAVAKPKKKRQLQKRKPKRDLMLDPYDEMDLAFRQNTRFAD